jgi:hypothetical protein
MTNQPTPKRDYSSLSVKDLLEAREAYHVHLANLENVVGTAIGRYRVRKGETLPRQGEMRSDSPPKTLSNTSVQPWSWPCVLVFVDRWMTIEELAKQPDQVVPRFLYLPDGRKIPTCVIYVELSDTPAPRLDRVTFPTNMLGGGFPILTEVQQEERIGSVGCLVTDGDRVYALTNHHVSGAPDREVFTVMNGARNRIGKTAAQLIGTLPFAEAYPGWPGTRTRATIDAGLIEVDEIACWTSQVYGIGTLGPLVDLHPDNISLDLVGFPVRAFGGASGEMEGEIHALFYRHRSVGGEDYVTDFLIGPRADRPVPTRPGDSGTLWFLDSAPAPGNGRPGGNTNGVGMLRPLAMQWGGHRILDGGGGGELRFALATALSTILRELELELVRDWNLGLSQYWGKAGHYKVGAKACELAADKKLRKLMLANQDNVGYDDAAIRAGQMATMNDKAFVPLADVADLVWRTTRKMDEANHFADMDQVGGGPFAGRTMLDLWQARQCNTPAEWGQFYDSLGEDLPDKHRGALPFRVWQMYTELVAFASAGKIAEFVAAAGTLAHYVGDACQPLHVSLLHHGRPGHPEEKNVHSVYETNMLDRRAAELLDGVNARLKGQRVPASLLFSGGRGAADAVVELMADTVETLPPIEIIEAFNEAPATNRIKHMWDVLGARTIECLSRGALVLAAIWESAWREGSGGKIAATKLIAVPGKRLIALYSNREFVRSFWLKDMTDQVLNGGAPAASSGPHPPRRAPVAGHQLDAG